MIAGDAPPTAMAVSSTSQNQNQSQNQPPDDGVSSYRYFSSKISRTRILFILEVLRKSTTPQRRRGMSQSMKLSMKASMVRNSRILWVPVFVPEEIIVETREIPIEEQLARAVLPIRGFGPKRLTEQEMGKLGQIFEF